jgi:hypothetical protein
VLGTTSTPLRVLLLPIYKVFFGSVFLLDLIKSSRKCVHTRVASEVKHSKANANALYRASSRPDMRLCWTYGPGLIGPTPLMASQKNLEASLSNSLTAAKMDSPSAARPCASQPDPSCTSCLTPDPPRAAHPARALRRGRPRLALCSPVLHQRAFIVGIASI